MRSDAELLSLFELTYDTNQGVLRVVFLDAKLDDDEGLRLAELYKDQLLGVYAKHPGKVFPSLVDTRQVAEPPHSLPKEAREIYQNLFNHDQTGKVAMVAGPGIFTFLTRLIIGMFMKKKKTQFFNDPTVALAWLVKE